MVKKETKKKTSKEVKPKTFKEKTVEEILNEVTESFNKFYIGIVQPIGKKAVEICKTTYSSLKSK